MSFGKKAGSWYVGKMLGWPVKATPLEWSLVIALIAVCVAIGAQQVPQAH